MANPTKGRVRARVRHWQKRLKLQHWELEVQFGPEADGASAACMAQPEYRRAVLQFDLTKIPAAQLEYFVCHELLHALVWPLANAGHALAKGDPAAIEWVRTEEESLVTTLEHLLVEYDGK